MEMLQLRRLFLVLAPQPVLIRRPDEAAEQRMRLQRLRLELRMELAADEEWMLGDLDHLDVSPIGGRAGDAQAAAGEHGFVLAVELVAMAMALAYLEVAIDALRQRVRLDL